MTTLDDDFIERNLCALFDGEEWDSWRVLLHRVPEHNQFIAANILVILSRCDVRSPCLLKAIEAAKKSLLNYQIEHRVYHWRLKNGRSRPDNAPLLNALGLMTLDADADCSAFQALALDDSRHLDRLIEDLEFYRLDNRRFRLPDFQRKALPDAEGTFLVWFPPKGKCVSGKIEQLDVVVQAHLLWLLRKFNRWNCLGRKETTEFLKATLSGDLILRNPYAASPYYPFPLVILYALSRAIVWGELEELFELRNRVLTLTRQIRPTNDLERLCLMTIGKLWNDRDLRSAFPIESFVKMKTGAFYAATNAHPNFEWLSRSRWTRFEFHSEALQWAMLKWLLDDKTS
ncbi:MAG: hypothetical protein NZM06_08905 [Chloroherpetonaceae bacterium]|nr:hypothetical protein [Chloroherpetonaceae bacterium]